MMALMKPGRWLASLLLGCLLAFTVQAQGNLEVDTPAISALKAAMQKRHAQIMPLYVSGAVGFAADGSVVLRDAAAVPLAQRGAANALVAAENADRNALYREIARANQRPEWEVDVRRTFAERWIDHAQPGWWVQRGSAWVKK